jgi:hypothetical protein
MGRPAKFTSSEILDAAARLIARGGPRLTTVGTIAEALAARWPDELGEELANLNVEIEQALRDFTRRRYGRLTGTNLRRVTFALVDVPYAAARRYLLAGKPPPTAVDDLVTQVCACVLDEQGTTSR